MSILEQISGGLLPTRRSFLKSAAATAALTHPLSATIARAATAADPASTATLADWLHYRDSLDGPWEAWHGDEIATWEKVSLPHCFNHYDACDPDVPYYRGQGWYRTTIPNTVPANNGRVLLHFEGAGQTTTVWVNDHLIGTHIGGYDEFVFDITDALQSPALAGTIKMPAGTVALTVLTDNTRDLERSPSDLSDFSLYGGLYRKVHLVTVPAVSFQEIRIVPVVTLNAPAKVEVQIIFYNPAGLPHNGQASITLKGPKDESITPHITYTAVPPDSHHKYLIEQAYRFEISNPALWSPADPSLYELTLTSDGAPPRTERFGLKHTEWLDHGPFKLNGEKFFLRGTQRHMDHAGVAAAQSEDSLREEFRLMKAMGVNFVRLAHYQQTKFVLDLCDELGILVWEESTWCRSGIGDEKWQKQTKDAFSNTIRQHYNHPSILIWGLGNEDDWPNEYPVMDKEKIRGFMQQMHDLAHSIDPTRVTGFRRCDFAADIPDVYSPSIWAGWYSGVYTEYADSLEKWRPKVKHLLHIEWGADSHAGRHAEDPYAGLPHIDTGKGTAETGLAYRSTGGPARISRDGDWSETYACDLFDWHLKTQETLDWFAGSAQWIFKDFTTPLRAENPVPRINQKGVLTRDLTRKESYFVFQSYWATEPMAHIYGHTWPFRWGSAGEQKTVKIYSNCDTAELFLNGKSLGEKKRDSQNFPAAGLRWNTSFLSAEDGKMNTLKVIATKNGQKVTDEISVTYVTRKWGPPKNLQITRSTVPPEKTTDGEIVTIEARAYDDLGKTGIMCLDAKNIVRFSAAGNARLLDNLGTPTGSRVVQLYNGRASIKVFVPTSASFHKAQIAVTADGLESGFYNL